MSELNINNLQVPGPTSYNQTEGQPGEGRQPGTLAKVPGQGSGHGPRQASSIFDPTLIRQAIGPSFAKLDPRVQLKNPVMFVVEVGSIITMIVFITGFFNGAGQKDQFFVGFTSLWLWFTVVFAN